MKFIWILSLLIIIILLPFNTELYSGTTITLSDPNISPIGTASISKLIDNSIDYFGPGVAEGFALANLGGYPFGKAYLGSIPHFFIGASLSVGLTNMKYFDNDIPRGEGEYPAGGFNPSVYFGLGLAGGMDFMVKLMIFNDEMYRPPLDYSYASLSKLKLYSIGGKLRYNLVDKVTLLPGLLSFGGINVSLGADYLYGRVGIKGGFTYPMSNIDITGVGAIPIDFDPSYTAEVGWYVLSGNSQIIAYFDFLWIFSLYTGFGFSFNRGSFELKINGTGSLNTNDPTYLSVVDPTGSVGSMALVSKNSYQPKIFLPVYIFGFDIAITYIHLTFETMANLRNMRDVNLQFGTRIQI